MDHASKRHLKSPFIELRNTSVPSFGHDYRTDSKPPSKQSPLQPEKHTGKIVEPEAPNSPPAVAAQMGGRAAPRASSRQDYWTDDATVDQSRSNWLNVYDGTQTLNRRTRSTEPESLPQQRYARPYSLVRGSSVEADTSRRSDGTQLKRDTGPSQFRGQANLRIPPKVGNGTVYEQGKSVTSFTSYPDSKQGSGQSGVRLGLTNQVGEQKQQQLTSSGYFDEKRPQPFGAQQFQKQTIQSSFQRQPTQRLSDSQLPQFQREQQQQQSSAVLQRQQRIQPIEPLPHQQYMQQSDQQPQSPQQQQQQQYFQPMPMQQHQPQQQYLQPQQQTLLAQQPLIGYSVSSAAGGIQLPPASYLLLSENNQMPYNPVQQPPNQTSAALSQGSNTMASQPNFPYGLPTLGAYSNQPVSMLPAAGLVQPQVAIVATDPATLRALLTGTLNPQTVLQPFILPQAPYLGGSVPSIPQTGTTQTTATASNFSPYTQPNREVYNPPISNHSFVSLPLPPLAASTTNRTNQVSQSIGLTNGSSQPATTVQPVQPAYSEHVGERRYAYPKNREATASSSPRMYSQDETKIQPQRSIESSDMSDVPNPDVITQSRHRTSSTQKPVAQNPFPDDGKDATEPPRLGHPPRTLRFLAQPDLLEGSLKIEESHRAVQNVVREPGKIDTSKFLHSTQQEKSAELTPALQRREIKTEKTQSPEDSDPVRRRKEPTSISAYYEQLKKRSQRPMSVYRTTAAGESEVVNSRPFTSSANTQQPPRSSVQPGLKQGTVEAMPEQTKHPGPLKRAVTFTAAETKQITAQLPQLAKEHNPVRRDPSLMTVAERARQWLHGREKEQKDTYRYSTCGFIDQDLIDCQEIVPVEDRVRMFDSGAGTQKPVETEPNPLQLELEEVRETRSHRLVQESTQPSKMQAPATTITMASVKLQANRPTEGASFFQRPSEGQPSLHIGLANRVGAPATKPAAGIGDQNPSTPDRELKVERDELSSMSIGEKRRLFSRGAAPPPTTPARAPPRRKTQPVTLDDLARANQIILARLDGRNLDSPSSIRRGDENDSFGFQERVSELSTPEASVVSSEPPTPGPKPCTFNVDEATKLPHRPPAIPIVRMTTKENRPNPKLFTPDPVQLSDSNTSSGSPLTEVTKQTVAVPDFQVDALMGFFPSEPLGETSHLDNVQLPAEESQPNEQLWDSYQRIAEARRAVRPDRRRPARTANPLKSLAQRTDLRSEYEEVRSIGSSHQSRTTTPYQHLLRSVDPTNKIANEASIRRSLLAESALAGLSSTENFSDAKNNLRQVTQDQPLPLTSFQRQLQPYKPLMLIQIKGRRHVQVRLVCPNANSLNSGDCFILVTAESVFAWFGAFANIVEVNKTRELASWIVKHHELSFRGCVNDSAEGYITVYEQVSEELNPMDAVEAGLEKRLSENTDPAAVKFWKALGYDEPQMVTACGMADEDEMYEVLIQQTNRVYQVTLDQLVPCMQFWGGPIKHSLLQTDQAYVFDFGSEVYLWTGTQISPELRMAGIELVQQAFAAEYDYSTCYLNPLDPLYTHRDIPLKSSKRPSWTLIGKVTERGETVLFKEKFCDWFDSVRMGLKLIVGQDKLGLMKENGQSPPSLVLQPFPADQLYETAFNSPPPLPLLLTLEGRFVGRGGEGCRYEDGILRRFRVESSPLRIWHVSEFTRTELSVESHGQFHQGDTYVIRWPFKVVHVGLREIACRASDTFKEQCAYFFWQGIHSGVTEQGAAALMTIELDEEQGPQLRVTQGKEPPAFCRLFDGRMILHLGKRNSASSPTAVSPTKQPRIRLFLVHGEVPAEGYLLEIPPQLSSLRSQGIFLVVQYVVPTESTQCEQAQRIQKAWLWRGRLATENSVSVARHIVNGLKAKCPPELGSELRHIHEVTQTEDKLGPGEMIFVLNAKDRAPSSLCLNIEQNENPLVIWQLTAHSGERLNVRRLSYTLQPDASITPAPATVTQDSDNSEKSPMELAKAVAERLRVNSSALNTQKKNGDCRLSFPFFLQELYAASQPALFLILAGTYAVYLWQGWWPSRRPRTSTKRTSLFESDSPSMSSASESFDLPAHSVPGIAEVEVDQSEDWTDDTAAESGTSGRPDKAMATRFYQLRQAALKTAEALAAKVGAKAMVVYAGIEPPEFIGLFPPCARNPDATAYYLRKENKSDGQIDLVESLLEPINPDSYTLSDLQQRPLPPELDAARLEVYLSDEEFQRAFSMPREEFDSLPSWKKFQIKKKLRLF